MHTMVQVVVIYTSLVLVSTFSSSFLNLASCSVSFCRVSCFLFSPSLVFETNLIFGALGFGGETFSFSLFFCLYAKYFTRDIFFFVVSNVLGMGSNTGGELSGLIGVIALSRILFMALAQTLYTYVSIGPNAYCYPKK